eukprot:2608337-Karenia_brevis.AAC.1
MSSRQSDRADIFWVPLPFHPRWEKAIKVAMYIINKDVELSALWHQSFSSAKPTCKIAWANMLRNVNSTFVGLTLNACSSTK